MPWSINKVHQIFLLIMGPIHERHTLGLDRNAPLPFQVHGIENLIRHLAFTQSSALLN